MHVGVLLENHPSPAGSQLQQNLVVAFGGIWATCIHLEFLYPPATNNLQSESCASDLWMRKECCLWQAGRKVFVATTENSTHTLIDDSTILYSVCKKDLFQQLKYSENSITGIACFRTLASR